MKAIAEQLRKTNIAEYLIYMWQVEDLLRANGCDIDQLRQHVLPAYDETQRAEMDTWLNDLCNMMRLEGVTEHGHLQINKNVLLQLTELHHALLANTKYPLYSSAYFKALPFIVELRQKGGSLTEEPELETCFNALYGTMLLRLQKKEISADTQHAIETISSFLSLLARYFKEGIDEDKE